MTLKQLRDKAIDLLARRDHSEKELEDKLRFRGGEEDDVAQILTELRGIGLLDDRRFARSFLSYRSAKAWGPRRYRQELQARGISREIVDEMFAGVEGEEAAPDDKLRLLVEKELARGRDPQKVMASLVRRGFGYGEVQDVLRRLKADEEFADD